MQWETPSKILFYGELAEKKRSRGGQKKRYRNYACVKGSLESVDVVVENSDTLAGNWLTSLAILGEQNSRSLEKARATRA